MQVKINRLGHHGDGVADGPLYAPMTLPGEIVTGDPDGTRLTNLRIVSPSDARVAPPCQHYKACGGCQVMHAHDGFVAVWKQDIVLHALEAQGLGAEMRPIVTSPPKSRRRATFAARRTKSGALVGFHGRASDTIVDTPACQLLTPTVLAGREVAQALAKTGASRKAVLEVQVTETLGGLDVTVEGGKAIDMPMFATLSDIAEQHALARLTWNGEIVVRRAAPEIALGPARVVPPPGAFLQATVHGQIQLTQAVLEAVTGARQIVDLFAGCGTFALPLASHAQVHAVEGNAAHLDALDHGWRHAVGLKKVTTEARDLFRNPLLADELARFDAAIIDPPRAGAEAQTTELAQAGIPLLAFVSCNPVTFARDAKILTQAGYCLDWVQVVDQFRWSAHVELVARFSRAHM